MSSSSDAAPSKHCHTIVPIGLSQCVSRRSSSPAVAAITASPSSSTNATSVRGRGTKNRSISSALDHERTAPGAVGARREGDQRLDELDGVVPRDGRGLDVAHDRREAVERTLHVVAPSGRVDRPDRQLQGVHHRLRRATAGRRRRRRPRTPSPRAGSGPAPPAGRDGRDHRRARRAGRARTSRPRATARARRPRHASGSTSAQGVSAKRRPFPFSRRSMSSGHWRSTAGASTAGVAGRPASPRGPGAARARDRRDGSTGG